MLKIFSIEGAPLGKIKVFPDILRDGILIAISFSFF